MPHSSALIGFALVAFGLVPTPGPNMIYLISRSITQGPAGSIVSLGGVALMGTALAGLAVRMAFEAKWA
jgi:threonine/homoserine/homoserine lactone efflux protein